MRTLKILSWILIIYGISQYFGQPVYLSSLQQENPIDPRVAKLEAFFTRFSSPLGIHTDAFLEAADKNGLDWKILPAIAMVESTGGKHTPSCAPFNPFGWSSLTSPCGFWRFGSFNEAIGYVAEKISYGDLYSRFQKERSISSLADVYNENPKDWASKLKFFMEKIKCSLCLSESVRRK